MPSGPGQDRLRRRDTAFAMTRAENRLKLCSAPYGTILARNWLPRRMGLGGGVSSPCQLTAAQSSLPSKAGRPFFLARPGARQTTELETSGLALSIGMERLYRAGVYSRHGPAGNVRQAGGEEPTGRGEKTYQPS